MVAKLVNMIKILSAKIIKVCYKFGCVGSLDGETFMYEDGTTDQGTQSIKLVIEIYNERVTLFLPTK